MKKKKPSASGKLKATAETSSSSSSHTLTVNCSPPREYEIADLVNIAAQLGCRVRFELIPIELLTRQQKPESPK